jgi:hypothetical protein
MQEIDQRLPNKAPFTSKDDLRLQWDFIKWLENWKMNAEEKNHFLSKETTEAIVIATKSTIAKKKHLLEAEYQFVLSQKFIIVTTRSENSVHFIKPTEATTT